MNTKQPQEHWFSKLHRAQWAESRFADPKSKAYRKLLAHMKELEAKLEAANKVIEPTKQGNDTALQEIIELKATIEDIAEIVHKIRQWCAAYPIDIFPEPDFKLARKGLESVGITMDAVSASNMRHVLNGVTDYADKLQKLLEGDTE